MLRQREVTTHPEYCRTAAKLRTTLLWVGSPPKISRGELFGNFRGVRAINWRTVPARSVGLSGVLTRPAAAVAQAISGRHLEGISPGLRRFFANLVQKFQVRAGQALVES